MRVSHIIDSADSSEILEILAAGQPAAFATDAEHRVIFWNRGAQELFGRDASEVLGQPCYEIVGGRDVFGNRFCYEHCPIVATAEAGEPLRACEFVISSARRLKTTVGVTTLRISGASASEFTLVHLLQQVDEAGRLARALDRAGVRMEDALEMQATPSKPTPPLTPREAEVLRWVARGLQNKEIAQELELSLATVRNHIHNILEKLDVHSKLEAVSLAYRSGWVGERPQDMMQTDKAT